MSDLNGRLTARARNTMELALREALGMGHNYIGTEHILLGILRGKEGVAAHVLTEDHGLEYDAIREEVVRIHTGSGIAQAQREITQMQARYEQLRREVPGLPASLFGLSDRSAA